MAIPLGPPSKGEMDPTKNVFYIRPEQKKENNYSFGRIPCGLVTCFLFPFFIKKKRNKKIKACTEKLVNHASIRCLHPNSSRCNRIFSKNATAEFKQGLDDATFGLFTTFSA